MKTRLIALLLLLSACTCNRQQADLDITKDTTINVQQPSFPGQFPLFKTYISQQDSTIIENVRLASERYQSLFAEADTATADSAFYVFYLFHQRVNDFVNATLVKDTTNYSRFAMDPALAIKKGGKGKDFVEKLTSNGFRLAIAEGTAYSITDYKYYLQHFKQHVSSAMLAYLQQQVKEQQQGYMVDGGLAISPSALAEKIVYLEIFLQQHPLFVFNSSIKERQREYTTFLLEGVDNTTLFDQQTKQLSTEFKIAFEHVLSAYPASKLAQIIKPYYAAIAKRDQKQQQQLLSKYRAEGLILDFSE